MTISEAMNCLKCNHECESIMTCDDCEYNEAYKIVLRALLGAGLMDDGGKK